MSREPIEAMQTFGVLVVDDVAINRQILQTFLAKLGHHVWLAEDGAQAVAAFRRHQPDMVLMDVMMPVMDGYEATRRIKSLCGDRWVPVVFLSALDKDENLVAGLDAGGDDYLAKPVNFVVLQAKLQSLERAVRTHGNLLRANAELSAYRQAQEAESALATDILSRQLRRRGLDDSAISFWIAPAAAVSGDVIAAARAASGELFVMLADATGHGLAASISTLPVLTLFYEMVEWGMALGAIVVRVNDQLRQAMPSSRFVAATMIMIDEKNRSAELWLGGLPPILLFGPDGTVQRSFQSNSIALGVAEFDAGMSTIERFDWQPGSQLAIYSDGLPEAENEAGEEFGMERLMRVLCAAAAAERLEAAKSALRKHVGAVLPHDDLTLLLVDCRAV